MNGDSPAVEIRGIAKRFGEVEALKGVSFDVPRGKILGLLGPNGAGKTTLVRILTTLLKPDSGYVRIAGYDVLKNAMAVRQIIGLTGQYTALDENLTGMENLVMVGRLYHHSIQESMARARELLSRFQLEDAAGRLVKTYSGGMRRRLDLAASLMNRPPILFLDEPTTGLDVQSRRELWEIIQELVRNGTTVLLTTQYLEEADHLSESVVVIDHGVVIASGTPLELKSRVGNDVLEIHLSDARREAEAVRVLHPLADAMPEVDEGSGAVRIPVPHGTQILPKVIRALDIAGIEIEDLSLRRPTLDEAFLKLTNRTHNVPV